MEPPAGRTKRAAASKAEGFFRVLASSGSTAAPGEGLVDPSSSSSSSVAEGSRKSSKGVGSSSENQSPTDCAAGGGTSDSPASTSDRRGTGSPAERSGQSAEGGGGGGGRQAQQQTKRKSGSGRGAEEKKGKVKTTTGDRPLKSAGRGGGGGGGGSSSSGLPRGQPGMKPRSTATSASVARVLGRLGEWGVKVRVPANPTVDDVWKAVDVVLRNLPDTSGLTVDSLGEGAEEDKGCYTDEAAEAKAVVAAAAAAECAKGRPVPPQKMVEDELAEHEEELLKVELKATASLQRLATTVEELRYDVNAPEEARWQAWAKETLREYAPLQEKMAQQRAAAAERISKKERIEKKLLKEEAIAVCYVCNGGEHFENRSDLQEIVFCERCCVAVHSSCYGFDAEEIHKPEKWYCDYCSHLITQAQEHLDAVTAATAASSSSSPLAESKEGAEATKPEPASGSGSPGGKNAPAKKRKVCRPQNHNHDHDHPSEKEPPPLGAASTPAGQQSGATGTMTPNEHPAPGGGRSARPPECVHKLGTGGAKDQQEAAAAGTVSGWEVRGADRSEAAGATGMVPPPTTLNGSSARAETERSRGYAGVGVAGGAVGEKAVHAHPSSPAEQSTKADATAAAQRSSPSPPAARPGGAAAAAREDRQRTEGIVAAAEAWCGAEASILKRDAQMATKRSWDDFENDANTMAKAAAAAAAATDGGGGGGGHLARRATSPGDSGHHAGPARESSPSLPSEAGSRNKPPLAGAGCGGRVRGAIASLPVTRMHETVEPPEVVAARAALEKAQEVIGVDLPSLDKGPEADCVMCHVPRGAFLRAERGSKQLGWIHCLCAFSKGLVIEDRVVKTRGFIKGDGTSQCHFCKNRKSGGLITCSHPGCNLSFHPLCARARGGTAVRGPHLHPRDWTAQCPEHAEERPVWKGAVVASTGPMPVREMYTTSKPPPAKKAASSSSSSSSAWVRPSPKSVMCDADPVVAGYRSEIKQTYAITPEGLCPPGKCHQCKRRNRWRAMCTTCDEGVCIYCICMQKESPRAVLAALMAHHDARTNGHPRPPNCFTCYKCRGICFCKECGGAGARAAVRAVVARAGGSPPPAPTKRDSTPSSQKKAPAQVRAGPVLLAPRPPEGGGAADPMLAPSQSASQHKLSKKRSVQAAGVAPASGSDKRPRKETPGCKGGDGTQQKQQQQQPRQHQRASSPALPNNSRCSAAAAAAAAAAAPSSCDNPLSTPNRYSSLESVLLSDDGSVALFPWMDQTTPAARLPPEHGVNTGYGNAGAWDTQFMSPSRGGTDRTGTGSEMQRLGGVGVGGSAGGGQANGGLFSNSGRGLEGGYGGPQQQPQQPSVAAAAAAAAVAAAAVPAENWRSQGTASPIPVRSASAGMPAINVSVSTMSTSGTAPSSSSSSSSIKSNSNSNNSLAVGGVPQSAVSAASTSSGVGGRGVGGRGVGGGVQTAAEAARTAQLYYQRAVQEGEAARKLTEDVMDAKAFSDRNNKAAMWRVDAATKLKDKLIMANELINGYCDMRRKAHSEAKAASAEEARAVARYKTAHAEAVRLQELAAAAQVLVVADSPSSWANDNSSNSSTTSNDSSAGGATTCSTLTERSESPASALTAALAAGMNGGDNYGGNHGDGNPTSADSSHGNRQGFPWTQQQRQQQRDHGVTPAGNDANGANNQHPSASFNSSSSSPSGGGHHPPTGVLTAMNKPVPVRAGDGNGNGNGNGTGTINPFSSSAAVAAEKSSRATAELERLRRAAMAASATVKQKEETVLELANRQKRAEAGRAELVRETQLASDSASKASQAAMHYEKVAQAKKEEEKAAFERARRAEWEAKAASDVARRLAEAERNAGRRQKGNAFFGAFDVGGGGGSDGGRSGGGGGSAVMPAAAAALSRTSITRNGGGFGDGGSTGSTGSRGSNSGTTVMPAAAAALARTNVSSNGGGFCDGGSNGSSGGTVMPAAAAALARTNIANNGGGFGDGGSNRSSSGIVMPAAAAALARTNIANNGGGLGGGSGGSGTVMPAAAAALTRTNITSNGGGFGDGGGGGRAGAVMPAAAAALARTNIASNGGGFGGGGEVHRGDTSGTNFVWNHGQNNGGSGSSYSNDKTGGSQQRRC
eukprot:g14809.t1